MKKLRLKTKWGRRSIPDDRSPEEVIKDMKTQFHNEEKDFVSDPNCTCKTCKNEGYCAACDDFGCPKMVRNGENITH